MPETFADVLTCLLLPACEAILNAKHQHRVDQQIATLAVALERYRQKHDNYPENLEALVPEQCDRIPDDLFSGQPLQYKTITMPTGERQYMLYSVGINEKDERANSPGKNIAGDDLVVMSPRVSAYRRLLGAWEVEIAQNSGNKLPEWCRDPAE